MSSYELQPYFRIVLILLTYSAAPITIIEASENEVSSAIYLKDARISEVVEAISTTYGLSFNIDESYDIADKFTIHLNVGQGDAYSTVKSLLRNYDYYLLTNGNQLTAYVLGPAKIGEHKYLQDGIVEEDVGSTTFDIERLESYLQEDAEQDINSAGNNQYHYGYTSSGILERVPVLDEEKSRDQHYSYGLTNDGIQESIPIQDVSDSNYTYGFTYEGIPESIPYQSESDHSMYTYGLISDGIIEAIPVQ